jgi:hypothetical protein
MLATFHERQYELAMNLELLSGGSGAFFAPMQVVEEALGFDIALVPGEAAIWQHLGIAAGPPGAPTAVAYGDANTPAPGAPVFSASLFCQYKRPERMIGPTAGQRTARGVQDGGLPYFRVFLDPNQHDVLLDLEQHVGQDAVVRYAAPCFHRIEHLWVRQATREVAGDSVFIAPSDAGNPPSCWTYDDAGTPIFCSEPRRGEPERRDDVLRVAARTARERGPERDQHLRALSDGVAGVDLSPIRHRRSGRWRHEELDYGRREYPDRYGGPPIAGRLPRDEWSERLQAAAPEAEAQQLELAVDAAVVANTAASIGLTWFLVEVRPAAPIDEPPQ